MNSTSLPDSNSANANMQLLHSEPVTNQHNEEDVKQWSKMVRYVWTVIRNHNPTLLEIKGTFPEDL